MYIYFAEVSNAIELSQFKVQIYSEILGYVYFQMMWGDARGK